MSNDNIIVRLFRPDEWRLYKHIRLKGLQADPKVFGSNYEKESLIPDQQWEESLTKPDLGVFGVFLGNKAIGMTGIYIKKDDFTIAVLWGSWLEKDWRGKGLSLKMYEARLVWAKAKPGLQRIIVSHRESNLASRKANQKHGFLFTHAEDHIWHDGCAEPEHFYELRL